jgi:hypothetical protein
MNCEASFLKNVLDAYEHGDLQKIVEIISNVENIETKTTVIQYLCSIGYDINHLNFGLVQNIGRNELAVKVAFKTGYDLDNKTEVRNEMAVVIGSKWNPLLKWLLIQINFIPF